MTVCYGIDMINISYINFAHLSKDVAKDWSEEIFEFATNSISLNASQIQLLEKCHAKLTVVHESEDEIFVRNVTKMFAQSKDDRKRVQRALEAANLPYNQNDKLTIFSFDDFFSFYCHLCNRTEVDAIFHKMCDRNCNYLTPDRFTIFLNDEQRDSRLNEILFPYYDNQRTEAIINSIQAECTADIDVPPGCLSKEGFLRYLLSSENSVIPIEKLELNEDMTQPLSHYFINSSHNTYLTGHQLTGRSSVEIYRQVLLSGCRCVELDCWDGKTIEEEPIVTHGFTMCTYILLKEVLEAIAETAFKVTDYPLILSFENHCSPKQQAKIAAHCRTIFAESLLIDPLDNFPLEPGVFLPSPEQLKRKILIKNKKRHLHKCRSSVGISKVPLHKTNSAESETTTTPISEGQAKVPFTRHNAKHQLINISPDLNDITDEDNINFFMQNSSEISIPVSSLSPNWNMGLTDSSLLDGSDESDSDAGEDGTPVIEEVINVPASEKGTENNEANPGMEMSALVNYIQPARFYSFELAEKRNRSYECTSFVETTATVMLKAFPVEFVNYNKRQISRVYPKGTRVDSSNYMPQIFWNAGCQLVALNFQTLDVAMQLNLGLFEYNGKSGYILKPDFMRRTDRQFDPFTESTVDGIVAGTVEIQILSGQFLTDRKVGTYVEVEMFGLPADTVRRRFHTKVIPSNGINPIYNNEPFVFRKVVLPNLAVLRIAVYSEGGPTLLGHRILPVEYLRPGYRHISLRNECDQPQGMATLFVHIVVKDYIPDVFADFAAALVNPIAFQSSQDRHANQLAQLEDNDEITSLKNNSCLQIPCTIVPPVIEPSTSTTDSTPFKKNSKDTLSVIRRHIRDSTSPFSRLGNIVSRQCSAPEVQGATASNSTLTNCSFTTEGASFELQCVELISLSRQKENKQFLKLQAKHSADLNTLKNKHEKALQTRKHLNEVELGKLIQLQQKSRQKPSSPISPASKNADISSKFFNIESVCSSNSQNGKKLTDDFENLSKKFELERKDMLKAQMEELNTLRMHLAKLEMQLKLQQLAEQCELLRTNMGRHKERQLIRFKKLYNNRVVEVKKKQDCSNWEEMKNLAKKFKDKKELARVRREAMQAHISAAVQQRQQLKSILDDRINEIELNSAKELQVLEHEEHQGERLVRTAYDLQCQKISNEMHAHNNTQHPSTSAPRNS